MCSCTTTTWVNALPASPAAGGVVGGERDSWPAEAHPPPSWRARRCTRSITSTWPSARRQRRRADKVSAPAGLPMSGVMPLAPQPNGLAASQVPTVTRSKAHRITVAARRLAHCCARPPAIARHAHVEAILEAVLFGIAPPQLWLLKGSPPRVRRRTRKTSRW